MMVLRGTPATAAVTTTAVFPLTFVSPTQARLTNPAQGRLATISQLDVTGQSPGAAQVLAQHVVVDGDNVYIEEDFPTRFRSTDTISIAAGNATAITAQSISLTIYPADRCTWKQFQLERGYGIGSVEFYSGNATAIDIVAAQLGYIGKSGRFVEIAL